MDGTVSIDDPQVVGRWVVPPRHCDAQQMMHASRPAEYFEDAFLAWLDRRMGGYPVLRALGVDLVLANVNITYRRPIRLGESIWATVEESRLVHHDAFGADDGGRRGVVVVGGAKPEITEAKYRSDGERLERSAAPLKAEAAGRNDDQRSDPFVVVDRDRRAGGYHRDRHLVAHQFEDQRSSGECLPLLGRF